MDPSVFRSYDVRGRTDIGEVDENLLRRIGEVFADHVGGAPVAVGRDVRPTSSGLADAMMEGLLTAGSDVIDLGEVPTEVVTYYSGATGSAGAMITASHNPPHFNGVKLTAPNAVPISWATGLAEIAELVLGDSASQDVLPGELSTVATIIDDFVDHVVTQRGDVDPIRIAVDGGNGMVGTVLPALVERTGLDVIPLYLDPDGTSPNHPADPLDPENLEEVCELVTESGAAFGAAFDGDADRVFFVDEKGNVLDASTTTALFARRFLFENPGATVIHNVVVSDVVPEFVTQLGGVAVASSVGHTNMKQSMRSHEAVFGGEHSGHFYFRDFYSSDSGVMALLTMATIVAVADVPLSHLLQGVPRRHMSGELNYDVADPATIMDNMMIRFPDAVVDRADGLTLRWSDRRINVRPSNTESLLRINVEADDSETVDGLVMVVSSLLESGR